MALLEVKNLRTTFRTEDGPVTAVNGLSFSLGAGETLGIVGESGSGKSVTSLSIMRLLPRNARSPPTGLLRRQKLAPRQRSRDAQDPRSQDRDDLPRSDDVAQSGADDRRTNRRSGAPASRPEQERIARPRRRDARKVRIPSPRARLDDYPHQFSGGMRQRVMIAMALSCSPQLLIADEPTTALDVTIQAQILELMNEMQQETGTAIVLITHDLGVVAEACKNVLVMYGGNMVEYGTAEEIFDNPRMPYTQGLLASLPRLDESEHRRLEPIKGQPPNLLRLPPGCAFAPRCTYRMPICAEPVPLYDFGGGHVARC